jgi:hypothetical protein
MEMANYFIFLIKWELIVVEIALNYLGLAAEG